MTAKPETREEKIFGLYREILNRDPDEAGLKTYLYSGLSIEQIRNALMDSREYLEVTKAEKFKENIEFLGEDELLLMGSSPRHQGDLDELKRVGVTSVLDLNDTENFPIAEYFDTYSSISISNEFPVSVEKFEKCYNFLYDSLVVRKKKTFVHSTKGVSRAPMVIALFLVAEKGVSFSTALRLIMSKQRTVNPSRDLVDSTLLAHVKGKYKGPKKRPMPIYREPASQEGASFVQAGKSLFLGSSLDPDTVGKLIALNISTILDLGEKKTDFPADLGSFAKIHLPVFLDQVNSVIPVLIRTTVKYASKGLFVYCEDNGILCMLLDALVLNDSGVVNANEINAIRSKLISFG